MHLYDIAFYAALFFILGIGAAGLGVNVWVALFVAFAVALVAVRPQKFMALFLLVAFAGFFYVNLYEVLQKERIPFGEEVVLQGTILRQPTHGIKSEQFDLGLAPPHRGEVRVYSEPGVRYRYGDTLEVRGTAGKSPTGRLNIISFPEITLIGRGGGSTIKRGLFRVKDRMIANINGVLPPRHAALASGILFGERAEFTDEFEDAMRRSGTTHIVALSGYNIAIIGITLSTALAYVMGRRRAFYMSVLAIPAFVVMTGAEASVVRAGIMGIILLLAERQSRLYSFRNAVTLTALAMLLVNPKLLVFDLGFQLSFAALLGIVYLYPVFQKRFRISEREGILGWRRNLFQTLSAQLAVAPIVLTSFGYFSPTALFANVLILEFMPATMLLSFLTAILGFVSFGVSLTVGWLASIFLGYEILIIHLFSLTWL